MNTERPVDSSSRNIYLREEKGYVYRECAKMHMLYKGKIPPNRLLICPFIKKKFSRGMEGMA
jgi:hypothetical protein